MKLITNRKTLLEAVRTVSKAAATSNICQEFKCILIEADMNNYVLNLICSNTEVTIQRTINDVDTKILQEGIILLPARLFADMLKLFDSDTVSLELGNNNMVTIQSGRTTYVISAVPIEKFIKPTFSFPKETVKITDFTSLIKKTIYAANPDSENVLSKCVFISFSKYKTTFSATDGKRLAVATSSSCADNNLEVLLHQHSLLLLCSVIKPTETLFAGISDKEFIIFGENIIFSTRVIPSKYCDFEKIIGGVSRSYGATVSAKSLYNGFDIVRASENKYAELFIDMQNIVVSSESDNGKFKQNIPAQNITPSAKAFYYQTKYILEFLRTTNEDVEIIQGANGYLLFSTPGCRYLVMPCRGPVSSESTTVKYKTGKITAKHIIDNAA